METSGTAVFRVSLFVAALALGAPAGASVDVDNDTVPDVFDNCLWVKNGLPQAPNVQCDTDRDGYGNACDADVNNDFGVGIPDFGTFTAEFGHAVGQSGLACAGMTPCP